MLGMDVGKAKKFFFDRPRVLAAMSRATHHVFNRWGAYTRKVARNSMKVKQGVSKPGEPPHAHTKLLKDFLFYALEPERRTVVAGPAKLNIIFFGPDRRPVTGTVPEVLEYGGQITVFEIRRGGRWQRADLRSRRRIAEAEDQRFRTADIEARPYMGPAGKAADAKLSQFWFEARTRFRGAG